MPRFGMQTRRALTDAHAQYECAWKERINLVLNRGPRWPWNIGQAAGVDFPARGAIRDEQETALLGEWRDPTWPEMPNMNGDPIADTRGSHGAILDALDGDRGYLERWLRLIDVMKEVRISEYNITSACNLRCKGCWFFEYELDKRARDAKDPDQIAAFLRKERERGINTALLIGGEPSLFPRKVAAFVEHMDRVNVATNGLRKLPREGFEHVALFVALFGGGRLDDELRAIRPGGKRFTGLFDQSLRNYRNDPRAFYLYALTEDGTDQIEEAVKRIEGNGNRVNFSFYSKYDSEDPLNLENGKRLLDEALRVKQRYPATVASHPYYIETMITGRSHWAEFGYGVCPTVSVDHPAHIERLANGNPTLPGFVTWASDLETINFCCTSGHCEGCRDSQVVFSWLLVSVHKFRRSAELLKTWIEIAESFWSQYVWSPYARQGPPDPLSLPAVAGGEASTAAAYRGRSSTASGVQAIRASK